MSNPFPAVECAPADHVWGEWLTGSLAGVPYRHSWCDVCGAMRYDQSIAALTVQVEAAQIVDGEAS